MVVSGTVHVNHQGVGKVVLDPAAIMGSGDALSRYLEVPLVVSMHPQPEDHQLAVSSMTAELHVGTNHGHSPPFATTTVDFMRGFNCRSATRSESEHHVQLLFPLTSEKIAYLDRHRHEAAGAQQAFFTIALEGSVVWMRHTGNVLGAIGEGDWPGHVGPWSEVIWFWYSQWDALTFRISTETWTTAILPKWDLDRYRILEVEFPQIRGLDEPLAVQWDRALTAYNQGRYADAVGHLRGILNAINQELNARKGRPIADIIRDHRKWVSNDVRHPLLDGVWKGLINATNTELHPESGMSPNWTATDCRWLFLLVTANLDYLGSDFP